MLHKEVGNKVSINSSLFVHTSASQGDSYTTIYQVLRKYLMSNPADD